MLIASRGARSGKLRRSDMSRGAANKVGVGSAKSLIYAAPTELAVVSTGHATNMALPAELDLYLRVRKSASLRF